MKNVKSLFTIVVLAVAVAGTAFALPPGKGGPSKSLTSKADFEALKSGDKLVLVCKASDSMQIIEVKDQAHALQLCKDGEMVHCPECKKDYKVKHGGHPAGKGASRTSREVVIVNDAGEPCMFYAKLSE